MQNMFTVFVTCNAERIVQYSCKQILHGLWWSYNNEQLTSQTKNYHEKCNVNLVWNDDNDFELQYLSISNRLFA